MVPLGGPGQEQLQKHFQQQTPSILEDDFLLESNFLPLYIRNRKRYNPTKQTKNNQSMFLLWGLKLGPGPYWVSAAAFTDDFWVAVTVAGADDEVVSEFEDRLGNSCWNNGDCGARKFGADESPPCVIIAHVFTSVCPWWTATCPT